MYYLDFAEQHHPLAAKAAKAARAVSDIPATAGCRPINAAGRPLPVRVHRTALDLNLGASGAGVGWLNTNDSAPRWIITLRPAHSRMPPFWRTITACARFPAAGKTAERR